MKKTGLFITFEGIEGCGKTTQMNLLADYLKKEDVSVLKTREPGGTKIGERIREILLNPDNKKMSKETEMLLYGASRTQHIEEIIRPALKSGKIVLCDRYADSTLAYQGFGRNMGVSFIKKGCPLSLGTIQPELTILLDLDVKTGLERIKNRILGNDRIEREKIAFHNKVRKGYLKLAKTSRGRIKIVKADKEIDEIQKEIKNIVIRKLCGKKIDYGI